MKKRRDQEENIPKSKQNIFLNPGNFGITDETISKLERGEYKGRTPQYRTSQQQTQQNKELPMLKNTSSVNNDWDSSKGLVNTNHARAKYEQKIGHTPIGRALSSKDDDLIYNGVFDMLNNNLSVEEAAERMRGNVPLGASSIGAQTAAGMTGQYVRNKDWEAEYGKSLEQILEDYSKNFDVKTEARSERMGKDGNKLLTTLGTTYMNAFLRPVFGAKSLISTEINPDSEKTKNAQTVSKAITNTTKKAREGVTANAGTVGKGAYNFLTDIGDRASRRILGPYGHILTATDTGELTRQGLEQRGITGRKAATEGIIAGTVDAMLDYYGLEKNKYIKGLKESGKIGKEVAGSALAGGGEQGITWAVNEAMDLIANGKDSYFSKNKENYLRDGDDEKTATIKALGDEATALIEQAGFGALLGATTTAGGHAAGKILNKIPSLLDAKAKAPEADTSDINNVIDRATQQAEQSKANVQKLQQQLTEKQATADDLINPMSGEVKEAFTPEQAAESRAAVIQRYLDENGEIISKERRGPKPVKALKGAELDAANAELASIDNRISALKGEIEVLQRDTWRGRVKLAAQKRIKAAQAEIKSLQASKTPINRRIKGESTPIIEQISRGNDVRNFKNRLTQIGKMTPEGKDIAKQANAAFDEYMETSDKDAFRAFADSVLQLHEATKDVPEYAEGYGNVEYGIFSDLMNDKGGIGKALEEIRDFHDNNFDIIPEGERKISQYYKNTMRNTDLNSEMDDAKYGDIYDEDDYAYFTREEKRGMSQRRQHIAEVGEENAINEILNAEIDPESGAGFTADMLDQAHILSQRALEKARDLEAQGLDATEQYRLAHKLHKKVREGNTNSAQVMQANQKWIKQTPQGAVDQLISDINRNVDLAHTKGYSQQANKLADSVEDALENSTDENSLINNIRAAFDRFRGKSFKNVDKYEQQVLNLVSDPKNRLKNISELAEEAGKLIRQDLGVSSITAKEERAMLNLLEQAAAYDPGSRAYKLCVARAMKIFDDTLPVNTGEKVKSVMYSNMLASLKTMMTRNLGGNVVANAIENVATPFQVLADKGISKITGVRSRKLSANALKSGAKGFLSGIGEWSNDVKNKTNTTRSGQDELKFALAAVHNPFKTKSNNPAVKAINKAGGLYNYVVKKGMELGDRPIYEAKYAAVKAELLDIIDKYGDEGIRRGLPIKKDANIDDVVEFIAVNEALESVLQNDSMMKEGAKNLKMFIKNASEDILGVDVASMSTVPFLEVPANMASRFFQYTPFGIIGNAARSIKEYNKTGAVNQRRLTGELGRNVLGGLMTAGGMYAASQGLTSDAYSDDPDEKKIQQLNGYQEYALQNPEGSTQVDFSDIPVFGPKIRESKMLYDAYKEGGIPKLLTSIPEAESAATIDTLFQGINKLSGGSSKYSSNSGGNMLANAFNAIASSVGSLTTPAFIRQTAQYSDDYKRDLGDYGTAEYNKNLILNGLPVVRENTLAPKIDTAGNKVKELGGSKGLGRFFNAYVAPWKISHPLDNMSDAQRYGLELGEKIDGRAALPHVVKKDTLTDIKGYDKDNYSHEDLRDFRISIIRTVINWLSLLFKTTGSRA